MGWIDKKPIQRGHGLCKFPKQSRRAPFGIGSIWRCPKCDKYWRYTEHVNGLWVEVSPSEVVGW